MCYEHHDPDELCASCGACERCVRLCEECGLCLDCADEADHCSECGACSGSMVICGDCCMCEYCAVSADLHCGNYCGNCYDSVLYCEICNECVECIGEEDYCFDCFQCKSHHTGGKCDGRGSHAHKLGDWLADASQHWKECHLCKEAQSKASHALDKDLVCTICGYDAKDPITITVQPRDARAKVSDTDADYDDPLCPNNNNVSFKVAAAITDKSVKGTLSYQWYYKYEGNTTENLIEDRDRSEDGFGVITGAQTHRLTTFVDWEACVSPRQYFCRITLTSSDGTVLATTDSNVVSLKASHVYNRCKPVDLVQDHKLYVQREDGSVNYEWVTSDAGGHKDFCCGENDEERSNPLQKDIIPHTYGAPKTILASLDQSGPFVEHYRYTCLDCGAVSYMEKHAHHFEIPIDYTDPEAMAFLEANCTDQAHPLRCTVKDCSAFIYEQHEYVPEVYAHPEADSPGQYILRCYQCDYVLSGSELLAVNDEIQWTPDSTLVTASNAAAQVGNSDNPAMIETIKSRCLAKAEEDDYVVLTPQQRDGYKVVGWTGRYTDYLEQENGKYKTISISDRPFYIDSKRDDGSWWGEVPYLEEYVNDYGVHGGGWLEFTPIYEKCDHGNGTKLGNKADAVCIYSGYTGDEVCVDCGEIIGKIGDFTPAPATEHTGELVLIEGTVVAGSCTQRGYTGDQRCSDCGRTVLGKSTSYVHNKVTVNEAGPTCTAAGYTGDTVCSFCGKKLGSGQSIPALKHSWDDGVIGSGQLNSITYTCTRCGETTTYVDRNAGSSSGVIDNVTIRSIKLTMSGYTIGNTLGDVEVTPTRIQSSQYTAASAYFFRGEDMPKGTDTTFNLGKMVASSYEIQSGEEFYLVVPLRTQNSNTFAKTVIAKLDGALRGTFIKDATVVASVPNLSRPGTMTTVSVETSVAVFMLDLPAKRNYSVKVSDSMAENSGTGRYTAGSTVTVHAGDKPGYSFVGWTGSDGLVFADPRSASTTFTMPAADAVVAAIWKNEIKMPVTNVRFTLDSGYAVGATIGDLKVSGENIGIQAIGGSTGLGYGDGYLITTDAEGKKAVDATEAFAADTTYYLAVHLVPAEGYRLSNTTKEDVKLNGRSADQYMLYKSGDAGAIFKLDELAQPASNARLVNVQTDGFGEAYASLGAAAPGTVITLTARANSGYRFKKWQVVSGSVTIANASSETATFTMPTGNVTVKAIFEPDGFVEGSYARYIADTGTVTLETPPAHMDYYLIAAYQGGQFVCFTVGTWPTNQLPEEARQADELRVFYLDNNSAPVAHHDILQIK